MEENTTTEDDFKDEYEETSWSLGDDYDCDTCGYTWNTLRWQNFDDGVWCLNMSVGCYGGDSATSTDEDFDKRVQEILKDCLGYTGFTEADAVNVLALIKKDLEK